MQPNVHTEEYGQSAIQFPRLPLARSMLFWATQQRLFRQMLLAAKVPTCLPRPGRCCRPSISTLVAVLGRVLQ